MTYWNIDSQHGQSLTEGLQIEREARKVAQSMANRLNETVYLYEVGSDESAEAVGPDDSGQSEGGFPGNPEDA
jgi:hypothetical protein